MAARQAAGGRSVALLRGINVGGKHLVPMRDLAAVFEAAGCTAVETYIQSGNVVFTPPARGAKTIAGELGAAIAARFGFEVPVVVRTAGELSAVVRDNPFLRPSGETQDLHVLFLADAPAAARVSALDPARSPPDEFAVRGREIYLRCPAGVGHTRLTNTYFDSKLATSSTGRNWRTVLKLLSLAAG